MANVPEPARMQESTNVIFMQRKLRFEGDDDYNFIRTTLESTEDGWNQILVMTEPPVLPKAGSVIIYQKKSEDDRGFMCDQYHRFISVGRNEMKAYGLKKEYYQLSLPCENHHPHCKTSMSSSFKRMKVDFRKDIYHLIHPSATPSQFVMIHYFGDDSLFVPNRHGNSKSAKVFTRSTPETISRISSRVQDRFSKPKSIYLDEVKNFSRDPSAASREPIYSPRDAKQVRNLKHTTTKSRRLANCEIFAIYEMAKLELGKFVLKLDLIPHQVIIVAEPSTVVLANRLLQEAKVKPYLPQLLCYDTTFELADSYVSVLVARNTFLHGNPIFPVAFMIHDRKLEYVHRTMWETISSVIDISCLSDSVPICVDREVSLTNAIRNVQSRANIVYCSNHVRRDIRQWLKNAQGQATDLKVIGEQITALIMSETEEAFDFLYKKYEEKWSKEFVEYMAACVRSDMKTCSKFSAVRFSAFRDVLPTNNLSESMNFVLKYAIDWKELPLDTLVLKFIELQCNHLLEFSRCTKNLGDFRFKTDYVGKVKIDVPNYASFANHEFSLKMKEDQAKIESREEMVKGISSTETLASKCLSMDYVNFVAKQRIWTVRSIFDETVYTLERVDGKKDFLLKCSCKKAADCYHMAAVLMSLKEPFHVKPTKLQLSVLNKKSRGHKKKVGRKAPNPDDLADLIKAASNSKYNEEKKLSGEISDSSLIEDHTLNQMSASIESNLCRHAHGNITSPISLDDDFSIQQPSQNVNGIEKLVSSISLHPITSKELRSVGRFSKYISKSVWLDGETIDRTIRQILQDNGQSNILYVPEIYYTTIQKGSYVHVLAYASEQKALLKNLVLIPVNEGHHWMLGVILVKSQTVILLDSFFYTRYRNTGCVKGAFQKLQKVVSIMHHAAEKSFDSTKWTFIYASDGPEQHDGSECGVIVCLNVLAIVSRLKLPTTAIVANEYHHRNRRWMLNVILKSIKTVGRKKQIPTPIQKNLKQALLPIIDNEVLKKFRVKLGSCCDIIISAVNDVT